MTCRPKEHLAAAGKLYPAAWKALDGFRASRGRDGLPDWPDWCYLPMAASYAVVSHDSAHGGVITDKNLVGDVDRLAALSAWRVTQGIYEFDPTLFEAVSTTPMDGDLPCELLHRLPEWCVYIPTPGMKWDGELYGLFAHLEWDANSGREELRLLLDCEHSLQPIVLHLGAWPLREALLNAMKVGAMNAREFLAPLPPLDLDGMADTGAKPLEPLLSLILYLCSENAEIGDGVARPENPKPTRTKKGWRMFPPDKPRTWGVGVRIGAALRAATQRAEGAPGDGTHASPRPHIRRAHWHTFRTGKGRADSVLRWLPPIAVNVDDQGGLPTTIRPVK